MPPEKADEEILKELAGFSKKTAKGLLGQNSIPDFNKQGALAGGELI